MTDDEMMEEEKEMKVSGIREKMKEFDFMAYFYQTFNRTESPRWRNPNYSDQLNHFCYRVHVKSCPEYSSYRKYSTPSFYLCGAIPKRMIHLYIYDFPFYLNEKLL
ncbi:hypothetical protein KY290_017356 [Solanum tuberosum]|uniref:Uncharacterized protein n=1 Tax=Solanum tuberosum TaxID=4113 RepID=A0ABQ7VB13_SOLTU|nr:hypothetical protein KY290_017356 [Solanum tuberosum]